MDIFQGRDVKPGAGNPLKRLLEGGHEAVARKRVEPQHGNHLPDVVLHSNEINGNSDTFQFFL